MILAITHRVTQSLWMYFSWAWLPGQIIGAHVEEQEGVRGPDEPQHLFSSSVKFSWLFFPRELV